MSAQSPKSLPPDVIAALERGNLIEAIKLLRASGGSIDLKQAKQAIEQHLDRSKVARATVGEAFTSLAQIPAIAEALRKGNKIEAIRILRERTGLGLKEAKDAVDRFDTTPMRGGSPSSPSSASSRPPPSEPAKSEPVKQTLSRPGLAPGEVPQSGGGRWLAVIAIVAAGILYYLYSRGG